MTNNPVSISAIRQAAFESVRESELPHEGDLTGETFLSKLEADAKTSDRLLVNGCERLGIPFEAQWEGIYVSDPAPVPIEVKRQLWGQKMGSGIGIKVNYNDHPCIAISVVPTSNDENVTLRDLTQIALCNERIIPYGCEFSDVILVRASLVDLNS